jgi:hypothetical protein
VSGVFQNIDPPPPPSPPSECVLPPNQRRGGTHSPGGEESGGSIFWKTPDIGLAFCSIISLQESVSLSIFLQPSRPLSGEKRGGGVPQSRGEPHLQRRVTLPALARTGRGRAARSRTAFPGQTRPVPHGFHRPA